MLRLKNKLIYLFEFWKRANLFLGPKWCPMRNAFSSPCSWRRRWRRRVRIHILLWAFTQLLMIFLPPCCCWSFSSSISISFLIPCLQCKVCIPIPLYSHKLYQPKRENKNIRKLLNYPISNWESYGSTMPIPQMVLWVFENMTRQCEANWGFESGEMLTLQPREQNRNGSKRPLLQISQMWGTPLIPALGWGLSFKKRTLALFIT